MHVQKVQCVLIMGISLFGLCHADKGLKVRSPRWAQFFVNETITLPSSENYWQYSQQVGEIEQGKFIEDRNVMCYMSCVYGMLQVIKNNKLSYEAVLKQVDLLFPPELKEPTKIAAEKCYPISKKYKDICEASYWTSKCMYDLDPKNFFFP